MIIQGRIVKGIGGFYYVSDAKGNVYECKARGRFRKQGIVPCVGDYVEFEPQSESYGAIEEILPRKNQLVRPAVANIDSVILVVSADKPDIDFLLCDKLLIQADRLGIRPVIAINKTDLNKQNAYAINEQYSYYDTVYVSALELHGIEDLKDVIRGRCVCLAGQSAVGKSSLVNALCKELRLETGGLSKKTERGKHTTRQAELLYLKDLNAYVVDTPGFSMFDIGGLKKEELGQYYREIAEYAGECKFASCMHDREPDCAVKIALAEGEISAERYDRYLKLLNLIGEKKE
ncbi:ribosome small subunit-dependent GTPase A [Christensenella timonensis]|uniref:ribosome small subunit-dependent GTPase A n=1 Tax=Christensenella timonensis TaxID=1816678 RepID=UPI0009ED7CB5|nr:ribosome small subunit-dependent GTPase A [Christensenella timonensis]